MRISRSAAAAMIVAAGLAGPVSADDVVLSSYGGQTDEIIKPIVYDPLVAATGANIVHVPMNGETAFARLRAESAAPTIDAYHFSGGQQFEAKSMGLLQDIGDLGRAEVAEAFRDPDNQWVAFGLSPIGILYNTEKMPEPPTSWADFARPDLQGHIAIPALTNFIGPSFLVLLARALGGGIDDVDPGFEALATMADNRVQIFERPASLQMYFSGSDVWMVPYDASNAYRLVESGLPVGFVVPEEGTFANMLVKVVAKGAPHADLARKSVAAFLTKDAQIGLARALRWSPVLTDIELPDDIAGDVLAGEALRQRVELLDQAKVRDHLPDWIDRFNREIASR
jgi:putative spermidine/putrescine transport system substrate-binding protein